MREQTVVCFGDSLTEGVVSASYIELLRRQLPDGVHLINAGENGDTVLHLLRRLARDVVAHQPDVVLVLVGLNDIGSVYGEAALRGYYRSFKNLWRDLPLRRFAMLYRQLVWRLREQTNTRIVLCTLTTLSERLDDPIQPVIEAYSNVVRTIAVQEQLGLVDLRRVFLAALAGQSGSHVSYHIWRPVLDGVERRLFGATYESIACRRDLKLLCDGVHLSEMGAELVAVTMVPVLGQVLRDAERRTEYTLSRG